MFDCKHASILVSKKLDQPLSRRERIQLWTHMRICSTCRLYRKQLVGLQLLFAIASESGRVSKDDSNRLSPAQKDKISKQIYGILKSESSQED